ncbi:MAG: sensor histidine kinase [Spirochaetaceae bacterium]|nr:sensor histidine kinase [Spirochaetaceae bacterium]
MATDTSALRTARGLRSRGRFLGFRLRLMLYFLAIIVLPLVSLGIVGPSLYARSIERETTAHTSRMIGQVTMNIEAQVLEMERLIDFIAGTKVVAVFLRSGAPGLSKRTEIYETLAGAARTHPQIAGLLVVNDNDDWIAEGFSPTTRDPLTEEWWYALARQVPGDVRLIPRPIGRNIRSTRSYGADEVVSVVKAVTDPVDGKARGAVLIDLRLSAIEELFTGSQASTGGFLFIADSDDEMVYAPVNKVAYKIPLALLGPDSSSLIVKIAGTDYQVLAERSDYTGWRTMGVFSLPESQREVFTIRYWTLIIGGITMALAIGAAFFFTESISKPVLGLRTLMKRAEHGDLSVRFAGATQDEIGELGHGFNEMIGRIQNLIDQVYSEQRSKREAELRILQEQIKPHFLYNTLDTIQWMAQEHRVEDVVCMVGALTRLFRIGLSKGRELISLADELEHVESYLCIQKMRYEDKFDFEIRCDPELRTRQVLRLILQPLVENAIYHGIKERRGRGTLEVEARAVGAELLLSVKDDGAGMSEATLAQLVESLEEGGAAVNGYGVRNVHERIRLTFGKPYGLSFRSSPGQGTIVVARHPSLRAEDGYVESVDRGR